MIKGRFQRETYSSYYSLPLSSGLSAQAKNFFIPFFLRLLRGILTAASYIIHRWRFCLSGPAALALDSQNAVLAIRKPAQTASLPRGNSPQGI